MTASPASMSTSPAGRASVYADADTRYPKLAGLIRYLNGLTGRADLTVLERLLNEMRITRADIEPACVFGSRGYRRNTISRTDHYELLALCWRSGDCTPIHDHRGVSCAFRVVEGNGTEIRYQVRDSGAVCPVTHAEMQPGYICAAEDADIHQVANMQSPGTDLITVHIYSPPITKMNTYGYLKPREHEPLEQCEQGHEGCL